MKTGGFLMLASGWIIALSAVAMLPKPPLRLAFVIAGVAIEALGLVLVFRSHLIHEEPR